LTEKGFGKAGQFYSLNREKIDQTMRGFLKLVVDWYGKEAVKAILDELEEETDLSRLDKEAEVRVKVENRLEVIKPLIQKFWDYACAAHRIPEGPYRHNLGLAYQKIMKILGEEASG